MTDLIKKLEADLAALMPKAESGADWADICAIEAEIELLKAQDREANSQFGVGA